jgi:hypothetical protein
MPLRFAPSPPGAIRERFGGRNLRTVQAAVRPSGIHSVTVVPTVLLRSVPAFLPAFNVADPRPSGMFAKRRGIPCARRQLGWKQNLLLA